jgi:hypothetical protein
VFVRDEIEASVCATWGCRLRNVTNNFVRRVNRTHAPPHNRHVIIFILLSLSLIKRRDLLLLDARYRARLNVTEQGVTQRVSALRRTARRARRDEGFYVDDVCRYFLYLNIGSNENSRARQLSSHCSDTKAKIE